MKKQIIIALISLLIGVGAVSAQLNDQWSRTYGGVALDAGSAVVQLPDGGYILGGSTRSAGAGNDDFYLVRTNSVGTTVWTRTFGGAGVDLCFSVIRTSDGGFAMGGVTATGGANNDDFFLVKTDANGDNAWSRTFGNTGWQACYNLIENTDQQLVLVGYTTTAGPSVNLGTASSFAVLAGASIPSTGLTVINGNLGIHPASSVTGFEEVDGGSGVVNGVVHIANATAQQAKADLTTAYDAVAALNNNPIAKDGDIGGQTLTAGLYKSNATLAITSDDLTLNAAGNVDAVWVFQMGSTLTIAAGKKVILLNGAQARNVYWQVGSSATLGANSVFKGTILALTSITAITEANIEGRLLARNGTVTLGANIVSVPGGGSEDIMAVVTDANGDNPSTFIYGGSSGERSQSIKQTTDGGYVIGAYTESFGAGNFDFYLLKITANGAVTWSQTYGGANIDQCYSVIQTADGGYALTGSTQSFGAGSIDAWLVKTDANGASSWTESFGRFAMDYTNCLIESPAGGYFLAGNTVLVPGANWAAWLIKTNSDGSQAWEQTYGGAGTDGFNSLIQTSDGGQALFGLTDSYGAGNRDFYLVKNDQYTVPTNSYTMMGTVVQGNFDAAGKWNGLLGTAGTDWRLSQWNHAHQAYVRLNELDPGGNDWGNPEAMTAGKGFWIIHGRPASVDLPVPGDLIATTGVVDVPLNMDGDNAGNGIKGLTMVANPFPRAWDWNSVSLVRVGVAEVAMLDAVNAGAISPYAYRYSPGGGFDNYSPKSYTTSFDFGAGEGFWIQTLTASYLGNALNVRFNTGGLPNPGPPRDDPESWELSMEVACSDGIHGTNENKLGCKTNSVDGFDVWDASEFGSPENASTQHYFPHHEEDFGRSGIYTYDFRSLNFDGPKVWNFTVRATNLTGETFTMTYPSISDVPEEYSLTLRDIDNNQVIGDMRNVPQVTFQANGNDVERHFSVTVISDFDSAPGQDLLPNQFGIISAYPNPFNNATRITFGLREASPVSIHVIDIAGRVVATLNQGRRSAGIHSVNWDAAGAQSGVYFLRLVSGEGTSTHKLLFVK